MSSCPVCGSRQLEPAYVVWDLVMDFEGQWTFVRCQQCGHGMLSPMPQPEALEALYRSLYAPDKLKVMRAVAHSAFEKNLHRARIQAIQDASSGRVRRLLDVGCGLGLFLERLQAVYPDAEAVGVELAPEMAALAAEREGLSIHLCPFNELDIEAQSVDVLSMNHMLEHLADPVSQLQHAAALIPQGGLLSVEVPCMEGWARRWFKKWYWGHLPPQHLQLFSEQSLRHALVSSGFEVVSVGRDGYVFNLSIAMILALQWTAGSKSPHRQRWGIRAPAMAAGLVALPLTLLFDCVVGTILNHSSGDILRTVARRTAQNHSRTDETVSLGACTTGGNADRGEQLEGGFSAETSCT